MKNDENSEKPSYSDEESNAENQPPTLVKIQENSRVAAELASEVSIDENLNNKIIKQEDNEDPEEAERRRMAGCIRNFIKKYFFKHVSWIEWCIDMEKNDNH